ncbi:LysR family transcriptional regulator [Hyphomicrobium sp.]|uniref:LysR family transcriptional regulator n=1 Tax=Hyphomicrobium sp. TaxID=82 RepID=UPI002B85AAFC|nr:LysR family transcriptional regulator [Hyphomicrobium sp.]HRN88037.1 LysR family transcriptional regulator [Hyphomicrobium sp.]HRQ27930.1 LysR family transcriptional regulator [Hyphomicrobium sp.]
MDWDKLRIFHAAAAAGSFTHAGDALHMSQSAVSRQVSALERDLKVTLFHRHARGLVLTEQGELLYRTVAEVMSKLQTAETLLADSTSKPSGVLTVAAPVGLGTVWIGQRLREFMDLYPDIRIDLLLDDDQVDIAMREADVAIWTREPEHADLIRRPLFTATVRPMASTKYTRRFGVPETLEDLDGGGHRILSYNGVPQQLLPAITWLENAGRDGQEPREPVFRSNSVVAIQHAVLAGIGIGMIPDYMTEQDADLIPVLQKIESQLPSLPVLYVYPEELKGSKKVQVLRDFLVAKARHWRE